MPTDKRSQHERACCSVQKRGLLHTLNCLATSLGHCCWPEYLQSIATPLLATWVATGGSIPDLSVICPLLKLPHHTRSTSYDLGDACMHAETGDSCGHTHTGVQYACAMFGYAAWRQADALTACASGSGSSRGGEVHANTSAIVSMSDDENDVAAEKQPGKEERTVFREDKEVFAACSAAVDGGGARGGLPCELHVTRVVGQRSVEAISGGNEGLQETIEKAREVWSRLLLCCATCFLICLFCFGTSCRL